MPARVLTVTLNYDHGKKFAHRLEPSPPSTPHKQSILHEARNKFRVKPLSIVYLKGGLCLQDDEDVPDSVAQVWVSKGEPYSGPPLGKAVSLNPGEVRIISEKSYIDTSAVKQLEQVARLPGVKLAVGMPDLHPGNRFPIGCAIAVEGIYPALIGSDVGCGIALYRLSSRASNSNPSKLANLLKGLDEPWSGSAKDWLARYGITRVSDFDANNLGTVGSGNHFAEICTPEKIVDLEVGQALGILEGNLYLLVHTGSRGLGGSILASHTANEANPYISGESIGAYLAEHDYAVSWAIANRDLVAHRIKECLYPSQADSDMIVEKIIDVTHNSVTKHAMSIGGMTQEVWVHRKGAAPADRGIVPCPGSRGDFTWLLQPIGDGNHNAHSLAHGAGRRHGRNALHTGAKIAKSSLTTTSLGSEVICTDPDLLIEERPEAYKDIQCVVDDMEASGVSKGVVMMRPVVTYKVREAGGGRK